MNLEELEKRKKIACILAEEAGSIIKGYFRNFDKFSVEKKNLQDYVSSVDREVENFILDGLRKEFPEDGIQAEESGGKYSDQMWSVDPLDGTSNFIRGIPFFCVSIAFVLKNETQIGIIYDPLCDELYVCQRGQGALCNGRRVQVSTKKDFTQSAVCLGVSFRTSGQIYLHTASTLLKNQCDIRHLGSAALALAYVACGRIEGFWEAHLNGWDCLAGLLLVEEAGGWSCNFLELNTLSEGGPVLACIPALKQELQNLTEVH